MNNNCPLTGNPCDKPKVFHITELKGNKATHSVDLCEDCMKTYMENDGKIEVQTPQAFKDALEVFQGLLKAVSHGKTSPINKDSDEALCPNCGITGKEVAKNGRFGCPECYQHIASPPMMKHLQGSTKHVGKVPSQWKKKQRQKYIEKRKKIPLDFRIKNLKIKMAMAAQSEKYERAASIKESIAQIEALQDELEMLKLALHSAIQDADESRAEELRGRISKTEDECLAIERSALSHR